MHNIIHWTYPEKTSTVQIKTEVINYVRSHGDGYGTDNIRFLDDIFESEDQAYSYINEIDNGFYGGYGVKFYDYSKVKDTKKITELKSKLAEIMHKQSEYINAHHVKDFKASFIGCSKCGSKLSKEYLISDKCPVCHNDLRAESTLERIASFKNRAKECQEKILQETQKQKDKANIFWLVKFEYHS